MTFSLSHVSFLCILQSQDSVTMSTHGPWAQHFLVLELTQVPPLITTSSTIPRCAHPDVIVGLFHVKVMDGSLWNPLKSHSLCLGPHFPLYAWPTLYPSLFCKYSLFKTWISHHLLCEAFLDSSRLSLVLQHLSAHGDIVMPHDSTQHSTVSKSS